MIWRRLPMLGVVVAGGVVVLATADDVATVAPVFSASAAAEPWMPAAPIETIMSTTWFCPAVPASGDEGVTGEVLIANADATELGAHVTLLGVEGDPVGRDVTVAPQSRTAVDVSAAITSDYAGAIVEITGGAGVVEQRATNPIGEDASATSLAACTTETSPNWYFAEGYTADGSTEQIVVMNPSASSATVRIRFATRDGSREPNELQSELIPPRSTRVFDLSEQARDEPEVAVAVEATSGEVLAARVQTFAGTGRRGYVVTLGAPAIRDQWWFADGEVADGVTERYSIYNPGDDDIEVTPTLLGIATDDFVPIDPIDVPGGQVVTFTPADVPNMPAGRHSMVFGTRSLDARVVVERMLTRTFDGLPTTSVVLGATARYEDAYVATTWTMSYGVEEPAADALVVFNVDAEDAVVTIQAVTPDGIVDVPGLEEVELPANGLITIDLTAEEAVGRQLILRATNRVFVERLLPRDTGALGRVGSWPLPAAG